VTIDWDRHLVGHSDADVLLHAVTDALLGAAGLDDIGTLFPNTDEANRGRDSAEMLRRAYDAVVDAGWELMNLDCVVQAQAPRIAPFREPIRRRIAEVLGVDADRVGVKGKTGEGVGTIGREEAIAATCVVLLHVPASAR